jgi:hypothetical protein
MLTKLKLDINISRGQTSTAYLNKTIDVEPDEEEEEDLTWQPSDTLKSTLKSLKLFEDMSELKKKEVNQSYLNFDAWVKSEVYRIVAHDKNKQDLKTWGDLE